MGKLKDQHIVNGACGAHAACLVAKDGKVYMFGNQDEDFIDKNTGMGPSSFKSAALKFSSLMV